MNISKLKVHPDETVKDSELFKSKLEFQICKPEIFKYGIMVEEVPPHIIDSDFSYLQSKIPAYDLPPAGASVPLVNTTPIARIYNPYPQQ